MVILNNDYHPDVMKILNPGFLILCEMITIIFKSPFCEISTLQWTGSHPGKFFVYRSLTSVPHSD